MEKRQLEVDLKLIKTLFDFEPMDWSRRDNGELVFLNFQGQKFVYTPEELKILTDKKLKQKSEYHPKPGPKTKSKADVEHEEEFIKELTEKQAPYEAEPSES